MDVVKLSKAVLHAKLVDAVVPVLGCAVLPWICKDRLWDALAFINRASGGCHEAKDIGQGMAFETQQREVFRREHAVNPSHRGTSSYKAQECSMFDGKGRWCLPI